jgi:hypothetical protein
MAEVKTIKINVDTKGAVQSVDNLTKSTKNVTGEVKQANASFDETSANVGKLSPAFGNAINGAKGLLSTFTKLIANPLGLAIAAIALAATALFKAFTSTKDGADQLSQVMAGLGAVVDIIRDRILSAGRAITKFFKGDFKGALKEAKSAVTGFGAEVRKEFKAAADATKNLQRVEDAFNRLSVSRAKVNRDLAVSKALLTDENASFEDKRKALERIKKTEAAQTAQELANMRKKVKAIKLLNSLSDTSRADKKKEQDAEIALIALEEESARNRRDISKQEKTLANQEKAAQKEAAADAKTRNDEAKRMREEELKAKQDAIKKIQQAEQDYADTLLTEQEREVVVVQRKYAALIAEAEKFNLDTTKLKETEAAEKLKIENKYEEARQKIINDANKKANDLRIQAENQFQAQIEAIDEANFQARLKKSMTESEYEIELVRQKYFTLEGEAKGNADQLAVLAEAKGLELAAIQKKIDDKATADAEKAHKAKVDLIFKYSQTFSQAMGSLNNLLNVNDQERLKNVEKGSKAEDNIKRKMFERDKKLRIVQTIIDTASNVVTSVRNGGGIPTGIPFGVAAGAMGALQIAAIAKSKYEGGSSTPPATGGGSVGESAGGQSPNFNVVGNSGVNQLAQLQQQPVQAFVVSGSVTTAQSLDRNRIENATL